jgi:hypothetical protein
VAVLRGCQPDSAEADQVVSRILEAVPGSIRWTALWLLAALRAYAIAR